MKYYPVNLNVQNRKCLVVGGGSVGTRKVQTLLECGAAVTVVSRKMSEDLKKFSAEAMLRLEERSYRSSDLENMFLVICTTSDKKLNLRINSDAEKRNMLCNVADVPEACNFILPAIVKRGDLIIAISTSGTSPAFAKKLRKDLEKQFGREYAVFLKLMGAIRKRLLAEDHDPEAHRHLFEKLIQQGVLDMIRENKTATINNLLLKTLGNGYECEDLLKD
ncbi:MAG: bifunctional precorrin-2 dehydrogenase/sirohydrochlorin ferrochelatase [Desulfobacterales bacterium]